MSAKREAERYFKRKNDYWMSEKARQKPTKKSILQELKVAAAAECKKLGIFGAKDYSFTTLARILFDESLNEEEAINRLCQWYCWKIEDDAEYYQNKVVSAHIEHAQAAKYKK